ncbi:MAG: lipoprotein-releasing ABC transporter permease subunit [Syntrophobacterales bacterium]|nr:MAG: lipoprotein-releasing ABC transporter permease subunit [Syntrophobacterales bacterium]
MPYELIIGLRYLKAKRKQFFISIITIISIGGVFLGVMALIIVLSVMNGFETDIKEKVLGTHSHIIVLKHGEGGISDYSALIERMKGYKRVVSASPFIYNQVMLTSKANVSGVVVRGIDPDSAAEVTNIGRSIMEGSLNNLRAQGGGEPIAGIIIGKELARHLGAFLNDSITVISPMGTITPMGMFPRMKQFKVVGIFNVGMIEYDSSLAYISLEEAQRFFEMGDTVTGIEIKVDDVDKAKEVAGIIQGDLGFPYWTRDWMEMNKTLFRALKVEKVIMFIILFLIVFVAAFNIVGTLIMGVMEKNKDIAILKSMGTPARSIMKIFIIQGLIIGTIGTILGAISGLLAAINMETISEVVEKILGLEVFPREIYYLDRFPSEVNPNHVVIIVIVALMLCFLATLYPSWKASKLDPVEALSYE